MHAPKAAMYLFKKLLKCLWQVDYDILTIDDWNLIKMPFKMWKETELKLKITYKIR